MRVPPVDAHKQAAADAIEFNNLNRWLVRNGHRAYKGSSVRRVGVGGRAQPISRPSDSRVSEGVERLAGANNRRRSASSLAVDLAILGLFGLSIAFTLIGAVWTGVEIARWITELIGGLR